MSTPIFARSGTRLTPLPPSKVPTLMVGSPMIGCFFALKSKSSSFATARAAREDVEVPGQAERLLRGRARISSSCAPDDAGAAVGVLVILHRVAPFLEHRAGVARAVALAAGRVDGVELQQSPGEGDGVH